MGKFMQSKAPEAPAGVSPVMLEPYVSEATQRQLKIAKEDADAIERSKDNSVPLSISNWRKGASANTVLKSNMQHNMHALRELTQQQDPADHQPQVPEETKANFEPETEEKQDEDPSAFSPTDQ